MVDVSYFACSIYVLIQIGTKLSQSNVGTDHFVIEKKSNNMLDFCIDANVEKWFLLDVSCCDLICELSNIRKSLRH